MASKNVDLTPRGEWLVGIMRELENADDMSRRLVAAHLAKLAGDTTDEWKRAALQARNDLRWIDDAFAESTPVGEDGPNPPLGPGDRFADWTSPANTMRWIDEMERKDESMAHE